MTLNYNVTGAKRKELVNLIANFTGCDAHYKGAPSFAYDVDYFTIDRNGTVSFDDRADSEVIERLLQMLYDNSFVAEPTEKQDEPTGITIQIPATELTEAQLMNLHAILEAKGTLIKKALGIDSLPVGRIDERLDFPWFSANSSPEEMKAYMKFITALCDMAKSQKRITAKEKTVDNEKYAFRCFLLRLGFIGAEYKTDRKILLRNLSGSSAFKCGQPKEAESCG
ncbi:MAG: virulence protein [Pseudoruminococcus massiliensis]|jgi:hypothetical protein|uniref:virulence protein n=1 Tax=Pseudoruminococcus massiliensis TaxID=2086583 RepID=UPI003991B014|nr:virulence protein [Oscillospiraceae bacterium]